MAVILSSLQVIYSKVKLFIFFILSLRVPNTELEIMSGGYYIRIKYLNKLI